MILDRPDFGQVFDPRRGDPGLVSEGGADLKFLIVDHFDNESGFRVEVNFPGSLAEFSGPELGFGRLGRFLAFAAFTVAVAFAFLSTETWR